MPARIREVAEHHLQADLGGVRLSVGRSAAEPVRKAGAAAIAEGHHVRLAPEGIPFASNQGRALLGHELTHVAQQRRADIGIAQFKKECSDESTPEARFAADNPGKAFETSDPLVNDKPDAKRGQHDPGFRNDPSVGLILWNFCSGESALRAGHEAVLGLEAARWKRTVFAPSGADSRSDVRLKVIGAASASGNADVNAGLARARADTVRNFLIAAGLPADRIDAVGEGAGAPLAVGSSASELARNRRVEITLFEPTTFVRSMNQAAATIHRISLGPDPKMSFVEGDEINSGAQLRNQMVAQMAGAALGSADVSLVGFQGAGIGFLQFLTGDFRIAEYHSEDGKSRSVLDWSHCMGSIAPCRDVLVGSSKFSEDNLSLFLAKSGDQDGTVRLKDSPGMLMPLRFLDPDGTRFILDGYDWIMQFVAILGIRDGSLFLPLKSAPWGLAVKKDVSVAWNAADRLVLRKSSGGAPILVHGEFRDGAPPGLDGTAAMAGRNCRLRARATEMAGQELPCPPSETRS